MELKLRLDLRQTQKLLITPTLQQAIKLLQLTKLDLALLVRQEMEENPVLEEIQSEMVEPEEENLSNYSEESAALGNTGSETPEVPKPEDNNRDFNWEDYFSDDFEFSNASTHEPQEATWENTLAKSPSLFDHLLWQLRLSTYTDFDLKTGEEILGNIDEHGYLRSTTKEIAAATGVEEQSVCDVLRIVQSFDPPGVGARDLKECLLLQIDQQEEKNPIVRDMITHHLPNLEKKKYNVISKDLGLTIQEVKDYVEIIRSYDPKPGRKFSAEETRYVLPDVYVYKLEDEYVVVVNDEGIPRLRVSNFYKQMLHERNGTAKNTVKYIQEKMRSAVWLIKSIQQRQMTLFKVATSIVNYQLNFLDKGISYLRPLTLKDVAEDISMHESTVSRVTTNKYIHTPRGIFELKYFFHSGLSSRDGATISSVRIREMIKQLVAEENPKKPYTDDQIVKIMHKRNIEIARRTVTKYRETEKILPSNKRKMIY